MCCKEGTRKRRTRKPKKMPVEVVKSINPLLAMSGTRTASGRWPLHGSSAKPGLQTSGSVLDELPDFNIHSRSAPKVPAIEESGSSETVAGTKTIISFGHELEGHPRSKPILLVPNSARIISVGQARSTAYATKQVKFATVAEIDTESDEELPSHKNLLRSFIAMTADNGKPKEYKQSMVESDTGVDRNNPVDRTTSENNPTSEGEREKENPGYARFMFDDVLESANMI